MFFNPVFKGRNDWWRYLVVLIVILFGNLIGSIPLSLAMLRKIDSSPDLDSAAVQDFQKSMDFNLIDINSNLGLSMMLLTFLGSLVAFYFIFKPMHEREFKTLVNPFSKIRWGRVFHAFFIWMLFGLTMEAIFYFMNPESYTIGFKLNTFIPLLLISCILLPIQTSTEELFFRGYIMQGVASLKFYQVLAIFLSLGLATFAYSYMKSMDFELELTTTSADPAVPEAIYSMLFGFIALLILIVSFFLFSTILKSVTSTFFQKNVKWVPLIVASVLFGLVHSQNPEIEKFGFWTMQSYYIMAGLFMGIVTIMDDGLELALGLHAAQNFVSAVFVGYAGGVLQTDSILKSHELNPIMVTVSFAIMSIIMILYFKRRYKWDAFSKLAGEIVDPEIEINENLINA